MNHIGGGLTRRSALGARGWLLPVAVLLPAALMTMLALVGVDRLYRRDAGVVRAEQLLPYGLAARRGSSGETSSADEAARRATERRWQSAARPLADDVAVLSWREKSGRVFVVLVARSDDPAKLGSLLRRRATQAEQVRVWPEGDRVVLMMVTSGSRHENAAALIAAREKSVRSSVQLQRAASLVAGAVVPAIGLAAALLILSAALLILLLVVSIPFVVGVMVWRRARRGELRRNRTDTAAPALVGAEVGLAPGVEVIELPERHASSGVSLWRALPLVMVALPAATVSLWPGSLLWAAVIALTMVLAMEWARGSVAAKYMRRLLYLVLGAGLGHALIGWPPRLPTNAQMLVGLAGEGVLVGVLVIVRRRRLSRRGVGVGMLGARWLLLWVGYVALACSSIALLLGSNGEADVRTNLAAKAIAVPGLVVLAISARRVRAARSLATRERLRREGRREVLYLRSFIDDRLRVRSKRRSRPGLERWLPWPSELFEDVLLRGLEQIGPVIAIGRPGTRQTELGASRELVIGEDWLTAVSAEMHEARFITVVLGRGEGLHKELLTLCERRRLDRVCIVVPPLPPTEVSTRLAAGTLALDGGKAWGHLNVDAIDVRRQIVALVGIGPCRYVMVARRRAQASAYIALTSWVSGEVATAGDQPV